MLCIVYSIDGLTNIIYRVFKNNNPDDYPILFRIYGAGITCNGNHYVQEVTSILIVRKNSSSFQSSLSTILGLS